MRVRMCMGSSIVVYVFECLGLGLGFRHHGEVEDGEESVTSQVSDWKSEVAVSGRGGIQLQQNPATCYNILTHWYWGPETQDRYRMFTISLYYRKSQSPHQNAVVGHRTPCGLTSGPT